MHQKIPVKNYNVSRLHSKRILLLSICVNLDNIQLIIIDFFKSVKVQYPTSHIPEDKKLRI